MEIKKNIPNNTITRKLVDLDKETGNIYESVNIIARRANQISTELKAELNRKLADFSSPTDTMEETFENREQIEISRYYERLPKPVIIATEEFLDHELLFKEGKDGEMKEIWLQEFMGEEPTLEVTYGAEGTAKEDLPLAKYPEEVTVHLGGGMNPNAKIPEGMTYEDNTFLDMLKEDLNINVVYDWVASSSDYDEKMNLCIGSNTIPELMNVNAEQYRALLKYDLIQPIGSYYEDYASDKLKSYVESGGEALQKVICNEDGEMMAIPAPNITAGGVNEMWIRQDWLDNLGLEAPRTWDEMVAVAEAFVKEDPDGNGENDTIGILGPANSDYVNGNGGNRYGLDPLFSAFQSYPKYWMKDDSGNVVYGSITEETKVALEKVAGLYADGLIDPEILVRNDSSEPLLAGKVGIFFGPWWCGYTVGDATLAQEADWQAYFTPLAEDGKFYTHMAEPTTKYVVASKECKNPEAAFKIINYLIEYEQGWVDSGITNGLSTSDLYPLYNVYDNANEIEVSYDCLKKYLAGEIGIDDVDYSTHKLLKSDMEAITKLKKEPYDDFSLEYWNFEDEDLAKTNLPRLVSIMVGDAPLVNEEYVPIYNSYDGRTKTMDSKWANLKKLEEETFAKIITGKVGIDAFDSFVEEWKASGGDEITKEVQEELDAQQ